MAPVSILTYQTIDGGDYAKGTVVQFPDVLADEIEILVGAGLVSYEYDPFAPVFDHASGEFAVREEPTIAVEEAVPSTPAPSTDASTDEEKD